MEMVTFNRLSWPLKAAIVMSWVVGILTLISFLYGYFIGLMGVI